MSGMHRPRPENPEMDRITVRIPKPQVEDIEARVNDGEFPNRSEAVRAGVRELLNDEQDGGRR